MAVLFASEIGHSGTCNIMPVSLIFVF